MPFDLIKELSNVDCKPLQHIAEGTVEGAHQRRVILDFWPQRCDEDIVYLHVYSTVGVPVFSFVPCLKTSRVCLDRCTHQGLNRFSCRDGCVHLFSDTL